MSKRNAALDALTRPAPLPEPAAVVELHPEPVMPAPIAEVSAPPLQPRMQRKPKKIIARSMLYLPAKAKKKFKEIAFHEERKEHDVYLEALREYLEKRGHKGLL